MAKNRQHSRGPRNSPYDNSRRRGRPPVPQELPRVSPLLARMTGANNNLRVLPPERLEGQAEQRQREQRNGFVYVGMDYAMPGSESRSVFYSGGRNWSMNEANARALREDFRRSYGSIYDDLIALQRSARGAADAMHGVGRQLQELDFSQVEQRVMANSARITAVNGQPLPEPRTFRNGDRITMDVATMSVDGGPPIPLTNVRIEPERPRPPERGEGFTLEIPVLPRGERRPTPDTHVTFTQGRRGTLMRAFRAPTEDEIGRARAGCGSSANALTFIAAERHLWDTSPTSRNNLVVEQWFFDRRQRCALLSAARLETGLQFCINGVATMEPEGYFRETFATSGVHLALASQQTYSTPEGFESFIERTARRMTEDIDREMLSGVVRRPGFGSTVLRGTTTGRMTSQETATQAEERLRRERDEQRYFPQDWQRSNREWIGHRPIEVERDTLTRVYHVAYEDRTVLTISYEALEDNLGCVRGVIAIPNPLEVPAVFTFLVEQHMRYAGGTPYATPDHLLHNEFRQVRDALLYGASERTVRDRFMPNLSDVEQDEVIRQARAAITERRRPLRAAPKTTTKPTPHPDTGKVVRQPRIVQRSILGIPVEQVINEHGRAVQRIVKSDGKSGQADFEINVKAGATMNFRRSVR
jgi:hypothetical protein